jgi:lysine-N-methylase
MAKIKTALALDYYNQFSCIGGACEDSCCVGWRVDIDKRTYKKYKESQHKVLAPLFKSAVKRHDSSSTSDCYGVISLDSEGKCSFLDQDKLCKIQKIMGPEALSPVCSNYPRAIFRIGEQVEYSLGLSCPEVARLVLLKREPLQFIEVSRMPTLEGSGGLTHQTWGSDEESPEKLALIYDLRALVIGILQHREIRIDARLMILGLLLEAADKSAGSGFEKLKENLPSVLEEFAGMLPHAGIIQTELDKIEPDYSLKLTIFGDIISALMPKIIQGRFLECLKEAANGLSFKTEKPKSDNDIVTHLREVNTSICMPFFEGNPDILENYLVDYAFRTVFPFRYESLLLHFREMVCNYLILKFLLLGMAAFHKKIDIDLVVKLFQSFTRFAAHNTSYMAAVISCLEARNLGDFRSLIVLLLDGVQQNSTDTSS